MVRGDHIKLWDACHLSIAIFCQGARKVSDRKNTYPTAMTFVICDVVFTLDLKSRSLVICVVALNRDSVIFHGVIVYGTCRHSLLSAEQKQIICLRLWYKNI